MVSAVIVAAGSSRRMGFDKLTALLGGRPVVEHSLRALVGSGQFGEVVLVAAAGRMVEWQEWAGRVGQESGVAVRLVEGGAERQESVAAGLAALDPSAELVAVHDAARPLVSSDDIRRVVGEARIHGAASLAHPVVETLKRADDDGWVAGSVDRTGLWAMETPQVFAVDLLRAAYASAQALGVPLTDEVTAVEASGGRVRLIASLSCNLKITHPLDLALAEKLMLAGPGHPASGS
jgi:2-C-methyl-D-erythritol 4-phosphate cytidylyltransferase